nr:TIM barrel protein [Kineococcus siccus]
MGLRQVEPFGLTDVADALAAALPAHGLTAPSTHARIVGGDVDAVLAAAAKTGTTLVIEPHVDRSRWTTEADVAAIAAELNAAAAKAADAGVTIGYHNHEFELEQKIGGRAALEVLADHLDASVALEVDTYWAVVGGVDVPELLGRLGSRVKAVHLKDGDGTRDTKKQVALGEGVLDIPAILAASSGVELGVIELDDTSGDVFEAVAGGVRYLTAAGTGA